MPHAMHAKTPLLQVIDGRGLDVRHVAYHRAQVGDSAQARVERRHHDPAARAIATWDPRLSARLSDNPATRPNLANVFSLCGTVLAVDSVDAGWQVSLLGEAGQMLERWDARGSHWLTEHDELLRASAVYEQFGEQGLRTSERYTYADSSEQSAADNLCGRLIRNDDGAGSEQVLACAITGQVLRQNRRFLSSLELPDWPADPTLREALLEPGPGATTQFTCSPTGNLLTQTDALSNQQTFAYGIWGQLKEISLTPKHASAQTLLHDVKYNAFAQIEAQTAGNGVRSEALFDLANGRLRELITTRTNTEKLQHLLYDYDPVGNVISIEDQAQPTRHFSNQRIHPVNRYQYDSLYQLIEATGREIAGATFRPELPELANLALDTSQFLNYTRHYRYDEAGNLLELKHEGAQHCTQRMCIAEDSNRALPWQEGEAPPDFATQFDANGNLQTLTAGQALHWDARNQLLTANSLTRVNGNNDCERYAYDAAGMRLRKTATAQAKSVQNSREVRYLPGLEIRTDSASGERLEVITLSAGRANVRYLHWAERQPEGIANDQLRYSVDDHLGSCTLELDSEARLISHEGYYPFGSTAWWAARSAVEAKYKVVRYSGKERDATGLYYYGLRYYAPWLQRWLNPDPDGVADGLNLYRMVANSPINHADQQGREGFDMTTTLTGVAAGLMSLALALGFAWQRRRDAERAHTEAQMNYVSQQTQEFGLNETEAAKLVKNVQRAQGPIEWVQVAATRQGQLRIFDIRSAEDFQWFSETKYTPGFYKQNKLKDIMSVELRGAIKISAPSPSTSVRSSVSSNASTISQFSMATSSPRTSLGAEEIARRRAERENARTGGLLGLPQAMGRRHSSPELEVHPAARPRTPIFTLDTEGFFEDPEIAEYLQQNERLGMEAATRKALAKYDPNRHTHTGVSGGPTADIILTGAAHGRGDYRLAFEIVGSTFRPHSIWNHKLGRALVTRSN
ncbi:RHS repeat domain-containing protein [Pseudomonas sp. Pseusp122]|uniref:RHS repeat domain-containing protein n=1 Tax=unclassified Pseudomonas TaxID=196821 RepID=UPI0039A71324